MKRLILSQFIFLLFCSGLFAADQSVVDINTLIYNEQPAIGIVFGKPVDVNGDYEKYISVTSPEDVVKSKGIADKNQQIIYYTGLKHNAKYTVFVKAGLKSKDGSVLQKYVKKAIVTRALKPSAWFSSPGMVAIPSNKAVLPVSVSNLDTILISYYYAPVESDRHWFRESGSVNRSSYDIQYDMGNFKFVTSKAYGVNAMNRQTTMNVELPETFFKRPGVYRAVMQSGGEYRNLPTATFIISDLGINLRKHPNGSWDIWARSLNTGEVLKGVTAKFVYPKAEENIPGETNSQGHLKASPSKEGAPYMLVAKSGDNIAIINIGRAMDLSDYEIAGRKPSKFQTFVYGPRDLYRGGETARWNILVRDQDGMGVDPGNMKIRLIDSQGQEKENKEVIADKKYGLYEYSYKLAAGAPTGLWKLELTVGGDTEVHDFSVEDFIPETMRLTLGTPGEPLITDKKTAVTINALGEYLYGAPAAGNDIGGTFSVRPGIYISDKYRNYMFASQDKSLNSSNIDMDSGSLDMEGRYSWDIGGNSALSALEKKKMPVSIRYFITLYESGGRAVNRMKEYVYLPTGGAIGIMPGFKDYASTKEDNVFRLINIDNKGEAAKAKVLVTLIKETRNYYWDYDPDNGWNNYYTSFSFPVSSFETETDTKPIEVPIRTDHGFYKLVVKNLLTAQETSFDFRAGEWWQYDEEEEGQGSDAIITPESLKITFDKSSYSEGAMAKVTVNSPYNGSGMVFAETSDGLLWSSAINIDNKKVTVEMPISKDWNRHDIYVSGYVARKEKELEKTQKGLVYGITHLPINREQRRIDLEMIRPEAVEPDNDFEVVIRTKNGSAASGAMVTLAAVDQGILSLKAFETPDPWRYFFEKKRYGSIIYDNFYQVIHKYGSKMATRYGGDAELMAKGGELARADVKIVSIFTKPVMFDEKGEARIKLNIPDYNGELRLMAAAFSADSFGAAEGTLKVFQPVVTELATPRFMSTGDKVALALDLQNMTDEAQSLSVSAEISEPLKLAGSGFKETVNLGKGEKRVLYIPVEASGSGGYGSVKVSVSYAGKTVAKTWRIAVRPPYPARTYSKLMKIEPKDKVSFFSSDLSDIIEDSAYFSVNVAALPPLGLETHFAYLLQYPYGCLEQTVSSIFPLVYATDKVRLKYKMELPKGRARGELIQIGLERLYGKQLKSGGFGYWDSNSYESPWGSVYAAEFMNEAKKQGFSVNKDILAKVNGRLASYVRKDLDNRYGSYYDTDDQFDAATKAYAAYVLSKYASISLSDIRDIYARYADRTLTPVPLMHMAVALKKNGDKEKAREAFDKAMLLLNKPSNGYYGDYSSPIREKAWAAALFKEYGGGFEAAKKTGDKKEDAGYAAERKRRAADIYNTYTSKAPENAEDILADLAMDIKDRSYLSTQERIRLLEASISIEDAEDVKGTIFVGDKKENVREKVYAEVWRSKALKEGIVFQSASDKALYAKTDFSGYPKDVPAEASNKASVTRRYYDTKGQSLDISAVKAGDFVVVELSYKTEVNTADGLLVDLIPAGFEIENQNIDNSLKLSEVNLPKAYLGSVIYSEFRDDRFVSAVLANKGAKYSLFYIMRAVTPGEYSNPSPYFEDMYRPEVRAIGKAYPIKIKVLPK